LPSMWARSAGVASSSSAPRNSISSFFGVSAENRLPSWSHSSWLM
jgi:hypothetical protein